MTRSLRILVALGAAGAALSSGSTQGTSLPVSVRRPADAAAVALQPLATGLTGVTAITNAGDARLFVTLQRGVVVIWDGSQILPTPFLDVSSLISCCGERGLLSTAFHPQYAVNGVFFVNYTNLDGNTVVARYRVSAFDRNMADAFSGVILTTIPQPYANHNGGQLQFGPDGYLYIGMGDGGSANDPQCNGQSNGTLLGKLLRIDVDRNVDQAPYYGIPAGNPYLTTGGPAEAWAFGLRNPWRFSFDRLTGDLFIADVGQSQREEIDYQPAGSPGGQNYGWKIMEGTLCGEGGTSGCTVPVPSCGSSAYTLPVLEYSHDDGACAVTGGYVYRGLTIPDLYGQYVYGDYCSGEVWAATQQSGGFSSAPLPFTVPSLTTFGEDAIGELYAGTGDGVLYRIARATPVSPTINTITPASGITRGGDVVAITGTNFTVDMVVLFGSLPASVQVQSPNALLAATPAHRAGLVDVVVGNPGAPAAVRQLAYGYLPVGPPEVHPSPRIVVRPEV